MNLARVTVQVTKVLSSGKYGGAIFYSRVLKSDGGLERKFIKVLAKQKALGPSMEVSKGQIWFIVGQIRFDKYGEQLHADNAYTVRPSGEAFIRALGDDRNYQGIGRETAKSLYHYENFPVSIFTLLDEGRYQEIAGSGIVNEATAKIACNVWREYGDGRLIRWLTEKEIDPKIGATVRMIYGQDSIEKIEEDPYRLLAFLPPTSRSRRNGQARHGKTNWHLVDALAKAFGIRLDDMRRLLGAVEECLYRSFDDGSTRLKINVLRNELVSLIGKTPGLVDKAIEFARNSNRFTLSLDETHIASNGPVVMELYVEQDLRERTTSSQVRESLFDKDIGLRIDRHCLNLNSAQRQFVAMAAQNEFSLLMGGAGTGKTTTLKALYHVMGAGKERPIFQMALAGRAARRMHEATGFEATTIAGFLLHVKPEEIAHGSLLVVDEASMLDLPTTFKLLDKVPRGCHMIFSGDHYQLPPIGPGLIFERLVGSPIVPKIELTEVFRSAAETGIPQAAASVRGGIWPDLDRYNHQTKGISYLPCVKSNIKEAVVNLYEELGGLEGDVLVVTPSKKGMDGSQNLSYELHKKYFAGRPVLRMHNFPNHDAQNQEVGLGLCVGDRVMFLRNDWSRLIFNGTFGTVLSLKSGALENLNGDAVLGQIEWDTGLQDFKRSDLDYITYSYAVTCHKAQGSQFSRVIIPIFEHPVLLDMSMIYTAMTRAQLQVVFTGDEDAIRKAVRVRKALDRNVGFSLSN